MILRNVLENPCWYTPYTPYQAEIAQGRLESLLNFQTIISELTSLPCANASLLDEATAAAEAMFQSHALSNGRKKKFFVADQVFPHVVEVIKTRAIAIDVEVVRGDPFSFDFAAQQEHICGVLVQNPDNLGRTTDFSAVREHVHENGAVFVMGVDPLSLVLAKTPGEMGADIAYGSSQRFGVPMGFGGPHAAFYATSDKLKFKMPGRIIGLSKDRRGNRAYRMALQTREQHIRRDRATSNICTAQALLANMAAFYGVWHGPRGLTQIA